VIVEERDEPRRPRRFFDREGRIEEEWWNGDGSARAHTTTRRSPGCVVEAYDYDGDSLVDSVCRTLTPCDSGACRTCGPFLRPIAGAPCAAGCAKDFTRCGCDERGDVEEEIADGSHTRRTTRRTDGGRRVERVVFHAEEELAREQRTYDAEGRVVEETTRDASGTRSTRTTFKGDGSSTATTTFDGAVVSLTTVDLSVPGERRDRVASGGQVETWLTRARGSEAVTIEFAAPMDESWFTCARDADCAAWVDRCDCDRGYTVNRRYLDRLRALRSAGCREPHGCPAELPARTTVARCVASLCAPGAP
jgi:YD repeat-containing protein